MFNISDNAKEFAEAAAKQTLAWVLSLSLLLVTLPAGRAWAQDAPAQDTQNQGDSDQDAQMDGGPASQPAHALQSPEQLQRLVAPIALYPDSLVAQILTASTFPEEVVEADRWVQAHPYLKGEDLGKAVDQEPWDPSVKALTAFPSVLGNMDKNLSWTSSLGDAYYNQQQDVMDAVQTMRHKAQATGNLKTTPQQRVEDQGDDIDIAPVDPNVVYVPAYNPWLVYGYPVVAWPGWYPYPGIWFGGPYLSFGLGFGIGWYGGFGWGWGHWGFNWHDRAVLFNRGRYFPPSHTFYNRANFYRGGRPGGYDRSGYRSGGARPGEARSGFEGQGSGRPGTARPFNGDARAARGFGEARGQSGVRSGAFSGYDRGGQARAYASRGNSSFHGGGQAHASGGGSHGGGGGHAGGGRH